MIRTTATNRAVSVRLDYPNYFYSNHLVDPSHPFLGYAFKEEYLSRWKRTSDGGHVCIQGDLAHKVSEWDDLRYSCRNILQEFLGKRGIDWVSASGGSIDFEFSDEVELESVYLMISEALNGVFPLEQVLINAGSSDELCLAPFGELYDNLVPLSTILNVA